MRLTNLLTVESIRKVVTAAGTPEILSPRQIATTIAFVSGAGTGAKDTLTDSGNGFLNEGFRAGDIIDISGSTSNNIQAEIFSVAAGTITLTESGILTAEDAGDTVTINSLHGIQVPDGVKVVIKAEDDNTGNITVAENAAKALNSNLAYFSHYTLSKGQSIELYIKNLNRIWLDATVNGDGVLVIFEK